MVVPARRTLKQREHSRRGHIELTVPAMHYDAATGEYRLSRRISSDGYYRGRQIVKKADNND